MKILLSILSVPLISLLFTIIYPYKPSSNLLYNRFYPNKGRYNRLEFLSIPLIFIFGSFICLLVYLLGILMRDYLFVQSYNYILKTPGPYFILCGIILGFGFIRIPMEFVYKRLLGKDEYELFLEYGNSKNGYDSLRVWHWFEIILSSCGLILFIWGMNWYVGIDRDNNIEINDVFSFQTRNYNISEVSEIECQTLYVERKGIRSEIKYYLMRMNDSYEWNSKVYTFFSSEDDKKNIEKKFEELSNLTKKPIHRYIIE